jgi:PAS domain S-box-containing protein
MLLIKFLSFFPAWMELLIVTVSFSILVFPLLYFFVFRPLKLKVSENDVLIEENNKLKIAVEVSVEARKDTEEKLTLEQEINSALMDNLPDHIYFKDLESRFIRINSSHARSFGLNDPSFAAGKTDFDFHASELAHQALADEQSIIKTGLPLTREEKIGQTSGSETWVFATKFPFRGKSGNIAGTFGISRDITKRKQAEKALGQSEERFRSVTQSATDSIITVNSKGKILGWNQGAEKTFGYNENEIIGQSLSLIVPENYLALHREGMTRMELRGEKHVIGKTVELHGLKKNGKVFPMELSLSEWEASDGVFYTGIIRDITRRKKVEMENHILFDITRGITSTSNLDDLLKLIHLSIGNALYAENCFIALHNPKTGLFSFPYFVDKMDKKPLPSSLGKSCTDYVFRTGKPLLLSGEVFHDLEINKEVELIGSPSPSWIGIPLQTPSAIIGVLVLQNYEKEDIYSLNDVDFLHSIGNQIAITIERKIAEEEIRLKNKLLQSLNAEKDKFFSILAHDLRNPLSSFVAACQILNEDFKNMGNEEIKEITYRMKLSAANLYTLLDNLLEWSRLQREGIAIMPQKLNIKKKIDSCFDLLSELARQKEIELMLSVNEEYEVFADSHMADTVIRNLISNAIKFTGRGGKIDVSARATPFNSIEILVSDSGTGMSPELIKKLFLLNERIILQGTEGESSSGLGLLLCKEFIEKNKGKIWVESEEGKGSTFFFSLPCSQ